MSPDTLDRKLYFDIGKLLLYVSGPVVRIRAPRDHDGLMGATRSKRDEDSGNDYRLFIS